MDRLVNAFRIQAGGDNFLADLVQDGAAFGCLAGGFVKPGVFYRDSAVLGKKAEQALVRGSEFTLRVKINHANGADGALADLKWNCQNAVPGAFVILLGSIFPVPVVFNGHSLFALDCQTHGSFTHAHVRTGVIFAHVVAGDYCQLS